MLRKSIEAGFRGDKTFTALELSTMGGLYLASWRPRSKHSCRLGVVAGTAEEQEGLRGTMAAGGGGCAMQWPFPCPDFLPHPCVQRVRT